MTDFQIALDAIFRLHMLSLQGRFDSEEAEAIRDANDDSWKRLTTEENDLALAYSAALNALEAGETLYRLKPPQWSESGSWFAATLGHCRLEVFPEGDGTWGWYGYDRNSRTPSCNNDFPTADEAKADCIAFMLPMATAGFESVDPPPIPTVGELRQRWSSILRRVVNAKSRP